MYDHRHPGDDLGAGPPPTTHAGAHSGAKPDWCSHVAKEVGGGWGTDTVLIPCPTHLVDRIELGQQKTGSGGGPNRMKGFIIGG